MEQHEHLLEAVFEGHDVRVAVDEEARVWICAPDLFAALDIKWSGRKQSLKNYPDRWIRLLRCGGLHGSNEAYFLSEPGVYKTLLASRKPAAQRFTEWVFEDLLPTVRTNGYYGELDSIARKRLTDLMIKLVDKIRDGDAFTQQALLPQLRNICMLLRVPVPGLELVGKDPRQHRLDLIESRR